MSPNLYNWQRTFPATMLTTLTIILGLLPSRVDAVPSAPTSLSNREVTSTSKAGLAWANGGGVDIRQYLTTGKVSWYYSWSPFPSEPDAGLEFVPMLWGTRQIQDFTSSINQTFASRNITSILAMNEPQEQGQANLTPEEGANMWKTYLEPLRSQYNIRLGSPAPSSAPSGKTWLQEFLSFCAGGCTVDFMALHYYDVNATHFKEYLTDYHNTFQRPLWVTEWACQNFNNVNLQCSPDDIALFLNETETFMDQTDFVERYAWFGAMPDTPINKDTALMDSKGQISDLGKQYIGAQGPKTSGGGNADGPAGSNGGGSATGTTSGMAGLPTVEFGGADSLHSLTAGSRVLLACMLVGLGMSLFAG